MVVQLSLAKARQDIRDALAANFTQQIFEGSIPSADEVKQVNGNIAPYIVLRFPDVMPTVDTSFAGPQGDTYLQHVFFMAVGPTMASAQDLYMKLLSVFLGFQPSYSSLMVKKSGGGTFEEGVENGALQVFISPINFGFSTVITPV